MLPADGDELDGATVVRGEGATSSEKEENGEAVTKKTTKTRPRSTP